MFLLQSGRATPQTGNLPEPARGANSGPGLWARVRRQYSDGDWLTCNAPLGCIMQEDKRAGSKGAREQLERAATSLCDVNSSEDEMKATGALGLVPRLPLALVASTAHSYTLLVVVAIYEGLGRSDAGEGADL
jgi:hypothetical protein